MNETSLVGFDTNKSSLTPKGATTPTLSTVGASPKYGSGSFVNIFYPSFRSELVKLFGLLVLVSNILK